MATSYAKHLLPRDGLPPLVTKGGVWGNGIYVPSDQPPTQEKGISVTALVLGGSRYPTGQVNLKHLYLLPSRIHTLVKLPNYRGAAAEVQG